MGAIGTLLRHDLAEDRDHPIGEQEYQAGSSPSAHAGIRMIEQHSKRGSARFSLFQSVDDGLRKACDLCLTVNVPKFVMQGVGQLGGSCESLDKGGHGCASTRALLIEQALIAARP
jgi:hypothetical protein